MATYSVVYKYPLRILDHSTVLLPRNAEILHIDSQAPDESTLWVWARVDPDEEPTVPREFRIFGTGHLIPGTVELEHRTSVVCANGLVWHVFEEA